MPEIIIPESRKLDFLIKLLKMVLTKTYTIRDISQVIPLEKVKWMLLIKALSCTIDVLIYFFF